MAKYMSDKIRMRSSARLAAVQACYMLDYGDLNVDEVVKSFVNGEVGRELIVENVITSDEELVAVSEMDVSYFSSLVVGVQSKKEDMEKSLAKFLNEKWSYERMDGTLRALLLCAVYEIINTLDVDVKVIIQEYVDLAYAFFTKSEPKMVNALLDQIAHEVRG